MKAIWKPFVAIWEAITIPFRWLLNKIFARHNARVEKRIRREIETNLSHELKTPLTCILAYSEMLLDNLKKKTDIQLIDVIYKKSKELVRLVDNLIEISVLDFNIASVYKSILNISNSTISVLNKFKLFLGDNKKYSISTDIELNANIIANEKYVQQMIFEILYNSYLYRKKDALVQIDVSLKKLDDMVILTIQDDGIGIKPKFRDKVFNRFFRIETGDSANTSGMGIGLTLSKIIVELFNGTIRLVSEETIGTSIIIEFPLIKTAKEAK